MSKITDALANGPLSLEDLAAAVGKKDVEAFGLEMQLQVHKKKVSVDEDGNYSVASPSTVIYKATKGEDGDWGMESEEVANSERAGKVSDGWSTTIAGAVKKARKAVFATYRSECDALDALADSEA